MVSSTHVVPHLHLVLIILLIEIFHLTVVSGVVVLSIIMMWGRIVPICMPIEGVIPLVLVSNRGITARCYRRRRSGYNTRRIASQRSEVTVIFVKILNLR